MSLSKDDEKWIDEVLNGFVDPYVATLPEGKKALAEAKATIKAKLVEARIQENEWTSNELTKDVQLPIVPLRVHRLLNKRLAELQGLGGNHETI